MKINNASNVYNSKLCFGRIDWPIEDALTMQELLCNCDFKQKAKISKFRKQLADCDDFHILCNQYNLSCHATTDLWVVHGKDAIRCTGWSSLPDVLDYICKNVRGFKQYNGVSKRIRNELRSQREHTEA